MQGNFNKKIENDKYRINYSLKKESEIYENLNKKPAKEISKQAFVTTFKNNFDNSALRNSASKHLLNQGLKFYNNGEHKKAINCFQIVLEMDPKNIGCKKQLMEAKLSLDKNDEIMDWNEDNILNGTSSVQKELNFEIENSNSDNTSDSIFNELNELKEKNEKLSLSDFSNSNQGSLEKDECLDIPEKDFSPDEIKSDFTDYNLFEEFLSESSQLSKSDNPSEDINVLANNTTRKKLGKTTVSMFSSLMGRIEGIAIYNLNGNLVFVNNTFAAMHGYSPENLIGKHLSTFLSNDQIPIVEAANNQIQKKGEFTGKIWHVRSDGSVFPILTQKSLLWDDAGNPIGVIGTYCDITNLRLTEKDLQKLNSAVEQSVDGIAITDLDPKLTYVNEAFALMHGYSPREMIGMRVEQIYKREHVEMFKKRINYMQKQGLWTGEMGCVRKDGTAFPLYLSVTLVKDDFEHPKGMLLIARDIIEHDRQELVLQEVNKNLDNIISTIHEPLIVLDNDIKIITVNDSFYKTFKVTHAEIKGSLLFDLENHQWDIPKLHELLEDILPKKKVINNFEIEHNFPIIGNRIMLFNARLIYRGSNRTRMILLAMDDITERKQAENELKWKLMKYNISDGKLYLVKESMPALSIEAFKDLLNVEYNGLIISRTPEKEFKRGVINNNCEFLWLAEKGHDKSLPPKLNEIEFKIENLPRKTAIFIDRGDYLIFKNGFKKTLSFFHRLRELAYLGGNVVIISIDPATMDNQELSLLEKECEEIESRISKKNFPDEQLKVLRLVYEENLIGKKPTYTIIGQEIGISKPTARKRIRILINLGYLMESIKGRNKVLELTDMGKSAFQN